MGSLGNPQTWPPFDNIRDCSQGFCSFYCPQWCYIIFPPPPPFYPDDDNSGTSFSPLVIAIIGILASAFLLVTYYTVISKYCGNFDSLRRRGETTDQTEETDENQNPAGNETWQGPSAGLDEALIKKITVCKYKKDDGFVEGSDCSVCLSEFVEDESLRLLPKCSHAFHLSCIDTWLKSHSNCPLCRANVIVLTTTPPPLQLPPPVLHQLSDASEPENNNNNDVVLAMEDLEEEVPPQNDSTPKTPEMSEEGDTIIEIREQRIQQIRRSVSMDASSDVSGHERVSIADVLCMSDDEGSSLGHPLGIGSSSSKRGSVDERNKFNNRSKALHCVASPVAMKRSFSSGRFLFTRQGRGKNVVIPM